MGAFAGKAPGQALAAFSEESELQINRAMSPLQRRRCIAANGSCPGVRGLGVAAGGNINPDPAGCSMFEPMGGSAPKYQGKDVINPIAAIAAMGMLLRMLGDQRKESNLVQAGNRVEEAIAKTTPKMESMSAGKMGYSTPEVGDLVAEAL